MKRKFLTALMTLGVVFSNVQTSFALEANYCAVEPYKVGNNFTRAFSKYSGANFLLTKVAQGRLKYELEKQTGDEFTVNIKPFGAVDFANGKFESLEISSKNPSFEGFYITDFQAKTLCGYNHVKFDPYDTKFIENFAMSFSGRITQTDLNKTILRQSYKEKIKTFNQKAGKLLMMKVYEPNISILDEKIEMTFKVLLPLVGTKTFKTTFSLQVNDGNVEICDLEIQNGYSLSSDSILAILNIFNPLSFDTKINKVQNAKIIAKNVNIRNNEIILDGEFIVPKEYVETK